MGPLVLPSLTIKGSTAIDKNEFGSFLSTHAQIEGLVPSEFSACSVRLANEFAENQLETQISMGPFLPRSLVHGAHTEAFPTNFDDKPART